MSKRSKNLAKLTGIALGAAAAASASAYFTTKYLVSVALDRKTPKIMEKAEEYISGTQFDEKFMTYLEECSEKLENTENETVYMDARDGERLVGHYIPCKDPKRIIIAVHGWRSSWHKDFGMAADFWNENNCDVIYIEQRGQNNSGGEYMGFGLTERYDCYDWVQWAINRFGDSLPIYLAGVSMGATTVLMATGLSLPQNVHGVMADCGFTSPYEIWKYIANKNLHISFGIRGAIADAMCKQKINLGTESYSTLDALKTNTVPILFAHGTDDHFVPVEMTYRNYAACTAPKTLLIVPGADHGMSLYTEPEKYKETVKDFWRKFDNVVPEKTPEAITADESEQRSINGNNEETDSI